MRFPNTLLFTLEFDCLSQYVTSVFCVGKNFIFLKKKNSQLKSIGTKQTETFLAVKINSSWACDIGFCWSIELSLKMEI